MWYKILFTVLVGTTVYCRFLECDSTLAVAKSTAQNFSPQHLVIYKPSQYLSQVSSEEDIKSRRHIDYWSPVKREEEDRSSAVVTGPVAESKEGEMWVWLVNCNE